MLNLASLLTNQRLAVGMKSAALRIMSDTAAGRPASRLDQALIEELMGPVPPDRSLSEYAAEIVKELEHYCASIS